MKKLYEHLIFIGVYLIVFFIVYSISNYIFKGEFDLWNNVINGTLVTAVLYVMYILGWLDVKKKK